MRCLRKCFSSGKDAGELKNSQNTTQERRQPQTEFATVYRRKLLHWREINIVSAETTARGLTRSFYEQYEPEEQAGREHP